MQSAEMAEVADLYMAFSNEHAEERGEHWTSSSAADDGGRACIAPWLRGTGAGSIERRSAERRRSRWP